MGLFARAMGVITSPRATFETIVAKPRPVGALFLVALLTGIAAGVPQFSDAGRQATLTAQVETNERFMGRAMTDEEYSRAERFSHYGAYLAIAGTFVALPIFSLIFTGLYWVAFNTVLGGAGSFKQVLAIVTHSGMTGALGAVLGAPIQLMQGKVTQGGPFNLGALAPFLDERSPLAILLGFTSIFTLWGLVVTAIGLSVLYRRKTLTIAISLIVVYFVIAYTLTSMFAGGAQTGR